MNHLLQLSFYHNILLFPTGFSQLSNDLLPQSTKYSAKENLFTVEKNIVCFIRNINLKSFIIHILKNILLTLLPNPFLHMLFLIQRLSCFWDNSLQSHHTSIQYLPADPLWVRY